MPRNKFATELLDTYETADINGKFSDDLVDIDIHMQTLEIICNENNDKFDRKDTPSFLKPSSAFSVIFYTVPRYALLLGGLLLLLISTVRTAS